MGRHTVTCQICPVRLSLPGSRDRGECAGLHVDFENSNFVQVRLRASTTLKTLQVTSTLIWPWKVAQIGF